MSDIVCVTNRRLCEGELRPCETEKSPCEKAQKIHEAAFLERVGKIAAAHPAWIILREKDLSEAEYEKLAGEVLRICRTHGTPCVLHSFVDVAIRLGAEDIHLPLPILRIMSPEQKRHFCTIGASCHSVEDAVEAEKLGCTYITAGHVFDTDCKKGLPGRGLDFLKNVCESVSIPVYGIGGIDSENIAVVRQAGAAGACVMSGLMCCEDVEESLRRFEERLAQGMQVKSEEDGMKSEEDGMNSVEDGVNSAEDAEDQGFDKEINHEIS